MITDAYVQAKSLEPTDIIKFKFDTVSYPTTTLYTSE